MPTLSDHERAYGRRPPRKRLEAPVCAKHPGERIPGPGAAFVSGLCRLCQEEASASQDERRDVRKIDPTSAGDRLDLAYVLHREKHGPPGLEPGSYEEDEALRRILEARMEEENREARKSEPRRSGQLVSARPEGGRWVETYRVGHRFVRVGAS